jgi:hypothetical protein
MGYVLECTRTNASKKYGHELPIEAQFRGPACRGITNLGIFFEQCVGA